MSEPSAYRRSRVTVFHHKRCCTNERRKILGGEGDLGREPKGEGRQSRARCITPRSGQPVPSTKAQTDRKRWLLVLDLFSLHHGEKRLGQSWLERAAYYQAERDVRWPSIVPAYVHRAPGPVARPDWGRDLAHWRAQCRGLEGPTSSGNKAEGRKCWRGEGVVVAVRGSTDERSEVAISRVPPREGPPAPAT